MGIIERDKSAHFRCRYRRAIDAQKQLIAEKAAFEHYEHELRYYVALNQQLAFKTGSVLQSSSEMRSETAPVDLPDFGLPVIPLTLKGYSSLLTKKRK